MDGLAFRETAHGSAEYAEALVLRNTILRAPLGLCYSEEDIAGEKGHIHVAGFLDGRIVAYGQLRDRGEGWLQMKQVAVSEEHQGRGAGKALVGHLEKVARDAGATGIVLHARETAAGFYDRHGYAREGERFVEVGIPHWRMRKVFGDEDLA